MENSAEYNLMVGTRIRQVRESLFLTRRQFGELCGISESFLAAVESGKKSVTTKTLYKICSNAHVSADQIVLGKEQKCENDMILEMASSLSPYQQESMVRIMKDLLMARSG
ncbi:MAG: helix-turn-helix transcriptional regulator [Lachnospiraceae bacterium]|nr:helix-turn-helix transcriptional regulator [Lachnospiraceae bacterium]